MIARLVGNEIRLSVPHGTPVKDIETFLTEVRSKFKPIADKRGLPLGPGCTLEGLGLRVEIASAESQTPGYIGISRKYDPEKKIRTIKYTYPADPATWENVQKQVNSHILKEAKGLAPTFFTPEVLKYASELGLTSKIRSISYNTNRSNLGLCYHDGRIEFSSRLLFYPPELRRLVIMHEFSHLTHHNHSPAFHSLLETYLGTAEAPLTAALRSFHLPLF